MSHKTLWANARTYVCNKHLPPGQYWVPATAAAYRKGAECAICRGGPHVRIPANPSARFTTIRLPKKDYPGKPGAKPGPKPKVPGPRFVQTPTALTHHKRPGRKPLDRTG